jgi:hypothetical protein
MGILRQYEFQVHKFGRQIFFYITGRFEKTCFSKIDFIYKVLMKNLTVRLKSMQLYNTPVMCYMFHRVYSNQFVHSILHHFHLLVTMDLGLIRIRLLLLFLGYTILYIKIWFMDT